MKSSRIEELKRQRQIEIRPKKKSIALFLFSYFNLHSFVSLIVRLKQDI
jgi:hypothetical protein